MKLAVPGIALRKVIGRILGGEADRAGDTIAVTIRWQALDTLSENYWLLLKVDQVGGGTVASRDSVPTAGLRTTDWWRKGEVFTSTHKLQLPAPIKNAPVQHFWRCTGA